MRSTLSGLTSRWTIPASWIAAKPGDHTRRVREPFGQRTKRLVLLDEIAQRAAGRELHRQEAVALGVADIEDAADVRVPDRSADAQLAREPLLPARVVRQPRLQNLDRHDRGRDAIERPQDDAAAALTEDRLDLIPTREHVSWLDLRSPLARDGGLFGDGGDAGLVVRLEPLRQRTNRCASPGQRLAIFARLSKDSDASMLRKVSFPTKPELRRLLVDDPQVRVDGRLGIWLAVGSSPCIRARTVACFATASPHRPRVQINLSVRLRETHSVCADAHPALQPVSVSVTFVRTRHRRPIHQLTIGRACSK